MKNLALAILIFAAVFGAQTVSAQEIFICTDKDGVEYSVLTETIVNRTEFWRNRRFTVDVKTSRGVENYSFSENDCMVFCAIGDALPEGVYFDEPEGKIWRYCLEFLGMDYEVRCDG